MIYLDSSALLKLLFQEDESDALQDWLADRSEAPVVSSELAEVEVLRAARRLQESVLADARSLLGHVDLVPLSGSVVDLASDMEDVSLRSLDALHLASALMLGTELQAFVTYDGRLLDAAETAGLPIQQPGG